MSPVMAERRGGFDAILQSLIATEEKTRTEHSGRHGDGASEKMAESANRHRRRGGSGHSQSYVGVKTKSAWLRTQCAGKHHFTQRPKEKACFFLHNNFFTVRSGRLTNIIKTQTVFWNKSGTNTCVAEQSVLICDITKGWCPDLCVLAPNICAVQKPKAVKSSIKPFQ